MTTESMPMSHVQLQELLGVYALDALDPETAALVEHHLDECLRCAVEVAQHHEVTGLLANSGGAPPARLWDGIAGRLDGTSGASWDRLSARLEIADIDGGGDTGASNDSEAPSAVVPIQAARRRWTSVGAGLVTAAAALIALVFGLQAHHLKGQVNALQAAPQMSAAERAALASPSTRKVTLAATGEASGVSTPAIIVLTAAGTGFVIDDAGDGLPPLPDDRTYQLWGVVGKRAISLGLLGPHPGIVPFSVAGSASVTAFAITDEVAGGVVTSTNQPVAVGALRV